MSSSLRNSLILAAIALGLAGYIVFFERGTLSTGELEKRKGTALPQLVRDRLTKLEIQRNGVTTVLVREPNKAGEDDEAALWRVEAPYKAKADSDAVDTLLGELEWLDGRHDLGVVNAEDKKRFGFDKPRVRIAFTVGTVRVPVAVGNESARGDGVYVQAGEPPHAWVVSKTFMETLSQEPGHYHSKELHDGMLIATTREVRMKDASGERGAKPREDGLWSMLDDKAGLASEQAVTEVIHDLDELKSQRFVAEGVKDLGRYGLAEPRFDLSVRTRRLIASAKAKPGEKEPPREEKTFRLRQGTACEGHPGESYITIDDSAKVSCALDTDLDKLKKSATALREGRILPIDEESAEWIKLQQSGRSLMLTKKDGEWSYAVSGRGASVAPGKAREGAVGDWLKELSAKTATQFDVAVPSALAQPDAFVLEVSRGKDKPVYGAKAHLMAMDLVAQRADDPSAISLPAEVAELLAPEAARFRPLPVLALKDSELRALEVTRGGARERVTRPDEKTAWSIEAPTKLAADSVVMSELARMLSGLEAVRFVSDDAAPEHGLATPAAVVTLEHVQEAGKPAKRTTLDVGAETEGGRYATVHGQPGVFVLATRPATLLLQPVVSRTLPSTPLEHLRSVEVQLGSKRMKIERTSAGFAASPGSELTPDAARALAETVATLRASRIAGYGAASPESGLQKPVATVVISADGSGSAESKYTLAIGAEAEQGARYARRSDAGVTFALPKESVERLLAPVGGLAP